MNYRYFSATVIYTLHILRICPFLGSTAGGYIYIIITVLELSILQMELFIVSMDFPYTLPVSLHVQGKGIQYEDSINKTENAVNCNENLL